MAAVMLVAAAVLAVGAAGEALAGTLGARTAWHVDATMPARLGLTLLVGVLTGAAFGAPLHNSPLVIVTYFVAPASRGAVTAPVPALHALGGR